MIIGKLICFLKRKHRRGKRISATHVRCIRCGAEWERAAKVKQEKA